MTTRLAALAFAVPLLVVTSGCSTMQARQRNARLARELDAVRYERPLDDVWQEVRKLLDERGFPLASDDAVAIGQGEKGFASRLFSPAKATYLLGSDVGLLQRVGVVSGGGTKVKGYGLETGWHSGTPRHRVRAEAAEGAGGVSVLFTGIDEDVVDHRDPEARDPQLELELARRLDPALAQKVEQAADSDAKK